MQVALFIPCLVDRFLPEIGQATVRLLESVGVTVHYDPRQTCCGQVAYNAGHPDEAVHLARRVLALFDGEMPVVSPSGSCVAMVRDLYGTLPFDGDDAARLARLQGRIFELAEFMVHHDLAQQLVCRDTRRVAVHHSCHHLRHVDGGPALAQLLERVGGLQRIPNSNAHRCCGFGGIFSARLPELSMAIGEQRLDDLLALQPEAIVMADAGCLLQLKGLLDRRQLDNPPDLLHYVELFSRGRTDP